MADRECIMDFIARDKPLAALALDENFETHADRIEANPHLYRRDRMPGTREAVVHPKMSWCTASRARRSPFSECCTQRNAGRRPSSYRLALHFLRSSPAPTFNPDGSESFRKTKYLCPLWLHGTRGDDARAPPFDGYVEKSARVSSTCLVSVQRNRYSVPCELTGQRVLFRATRVTLNSRLAVPPAPLSFSSPGKLRELRHGIPRSFP